METIQAKHKEYEMTTLTKATVYISKGLGDILDYLHGVTFDYGTADFYSKGLLQDIVNEREDYEELTHEDVEDLEDAVELLEKVDFVTLEISL